jgi:hypothetical protein
MKKIFLFVAVLSLVFACSKYENNYKNYQKSLGVYEITGEDAIDFQINLDNGNVVIPAETSGYQSEYDDGDRVIVYYSKHSDETDSIDEQVINSEIHQIDKILTKEVITLTDEIADSIGNNAIHVHGEHIWISKNFLNIYFSYYGGSQTHYVNMIKYPNDSLDDDGRMVLEFRHNNNNDYLNYVYDGLVSFDMNSLQKHDIDSLPIVVKVIDYYGEPLVWRETYYFNQTSESSKIVTIQNSGSSFE